MKRGWPHPQPLTPRFWAKVDITPGCWEWTGFRNKTGYGSIRLGPQGTERVHRVSWSLHFGPIPSEQHVLHRCDNRRCVNPDHLFMGTHQDNMADRGNKGRSFRPQGSKHYASTLVESQVRAYRARYAAGEKSAALASEAGANISTFRKMLHGATWRHVQ